MRSLIVAFLRFLIDLFTKKSPIGFDQEFGWWTDYDVVLSPSPTVPAPPKPLVNNDCERSHVVYSVAINRVDVCNFPARQQALADAIDQATRYFNDHFECRNEKCIQKVGDLLWIGVSCTKGPPTVATAAVLVRFRCEIQV
jgi:hypothetical protein